MKAKGEGIWKKMQSKLIYMSRAFSWYQNGANRLRIVATGL